MNGGKRHFRVLIIAAETSRAEAILRHLHEARLAVRGLFTQHAAKVPGLLREHRCDLMLLCVGAGIEAAELAAILEREQVDTPSLILDFEGAEASALVALMRAGAEGLISSLEDGRLAANIRRRLRHVSDGERRSSLKQQLRQVTNTMVGLIQHCPGPIALLADGVIIDTNAAFAQLLGYTAGQLPSGRRFSELAAGDGAAELENRLSRALLLEEEDPAANLVTLSRADGSDVEVRLSPLPIEIDDESRIAVFMDPLRSAGFARPGQTIDAETGLPDRAALLTLLAERMAADSLIERTIALVYARLEDYGRLCARYGLERGLRHAAQAAAMLHAAMPEGAITARISDDACASLIDDPGAQDKEALVERLQDRLYAKADAGEPPRYRFGVAFGTSGKSAPARMLDTAFADSLRRPGGGSAMTEQPASELQSVLRSLKQGESSLLVESASGAASVPEAASQLSETQDEGLEGLAQSAALSSAMSALEGGMEEERPLSGLLEDSVTARIEHALESDGFMLAYQPIISLMGDSQEHYSVLVRLQGEQDRLLTAQEVLGPAARAGSLPDIDRWVIQRALREQAQRRKAGQKVGCFLSLSPEIVQDERLLIWICDTLREYEIRGSWVTFQTAEQDANALGEKWLKLADGLKKIRCRICINQYGLDEQSEHLMADLRADFVKFAPELAIGLSDDPSMQKRLLQLIQLAQDRRVKTIVTGVEDARSLALLWSAGIDYVQGNFLQAAMPNLETPA